MTGFMLALFLIAAGFAVHYRHQSQVLAREIIRRQAGHAELERIAREMIRRENCDWRFAIADAGFSQSWHDDMILALLSLEPDP